MTLATRRAWLVRSILMTCLWFPALATHAEWWELAKLTPADNAVGDRFGNAIATDGTRLIVGAMADDDRGLSSGAAYVYVHGSSGWVFETKLVPADIGAGDQFGIAVDIANERAIVGSYSLDGAHGGVAYIYELVGGVWTQAARLRPAALAITDSYGVSVGISNDMAIVGAPYDDDRAAYAGCAYIYMRTAGVWAERTAFRPLDLQAYDYFGQSVDVSRFWSSYPPPSGYWFAIGSPGDGDAGAGAGAVYLYDKDFMVDPGWRGTKLTPSDGSLSGMGSSVAVNGYDSPFCVAGAPSPPSIGRAFVYVHPLSGGGWTLHSTLNPSDGLAGDHFGEAVAIAAGNGGWRACIGAPYALVTGASAGAAYLFETYSGGVRQLPRLVAHDRALSDYFGTSVGIGLHTAAIGASGDDDHGSRSGAAYVFSDQSDIRLSGVVWDDRDDDGVRDPEDPGLASWGVFLDANANGIYDAGEWYVQTLADGSYSMQNVAPGTYAMHEQMQPSWSCTYPTGDMHPVTVVLGQQVANLDFGNHNTATSSPDSPGSILQLEQSHPNPFNSKTTLAYELGRSGPLRIYVLGLRGELVRTLFRGTMPAGRHDVAWDGRDKAGLRVASGIYLIRFEAQGASQQRKVALVQ